MGVIEMDNSGNKKRHNKTADLRISSSIYLVLIYNALSNATKLVPYSSNGNGIPLNPINAWVA